jgi:hypothetical protein
MNSQQPLNALRAWKPLVVFYIVFIALELGSYTRTSAVWDEPVHVVDGYRSLAGGDFRFDPEHPPFLRELNALPLWLTGVTPFGDGGIDEMTPMAWSQRLHIVASNELYNGRDADALLYRARFMTVLLGCLLGTIVFLWARDVWGERAGLVALALVTLEPNLRAHASLVTTDLGFTAFAVLGIYGVWRASARWSRAAAATAVAGVALAVVSKFTAVVLLALMPLLLGASVLAGRLSVRRAMVVAAGTAAASWFAIWAVYGFRFAPSANPAWLYAFHRDPGVAAALPTLSGVIGWIDDHRVLPNVYAQGFLLGQYKSLTRPAFLAGEIGTGWWYFFPIAFLLKTPLALIGGALVGAAALCWPRARRAPAAVFLLLPVLMFLGAAMASRLNIGLRHILPVYPFVILLAVAAFDAVSRRGRAAASAAAAVLILGTGAEVARAYPSDLAFFNTAAGGPDAGGRYLVDSNLDWGQDLKGLKAWMDRAGVPRVALGYFGTAKPPYYDIDAIELPGSAFYNGVPPQFPTYVAVSATLQSGVYLAPAMRAFYRTFDARSPVATVGHSIRIYWVDRPWW